MGMKFNLITDKDKKIAVDSIPITPILKATVLNPADLDAPPLVEFRGELVEQEEILALIEGFMITGKYRHVHSKPVVIKGADLEVSHTFRKLRKMCAGDNMDVAFKVV